MTKPGENAIRDNDEAIEELLGHASPRPAPPEQAVRQAKRAVQAQWELTTRKSATRRRWLAAGAAAGIALAATIVTNVLLVPASQPVQVASLDKAVGTVYLLGEKSELSPVVDLDAVRSGDTIRTARGASAGLSWNNGGSLRLDENTEVRFVSTERIELHGGRVYYDTLPGAAQAAGLTIETREGNVTHVGTQFMAAVDDASLTVSVREGRVQVDGYHRRIVDAGNQVRFVGSSQPEVLDIRGYGPEWRWIEATAPIRMQGGKSLKDLLAWVARETGYSIVFGDGIEAEIDEVELTGVVRDTPRGALEKSLRVSALDYEFDDENGVIIISYAGR